MRFLRRKREEFAGEDAMVAYLEGRARKPVEDRAKRLEEDRGKRRRFRAREKNDR
jgi:hypothetical protein